MKAAFQAHNLQRGKFAIGYDHSREEPKESDLLHMIPHPDAERHVEGDYFAAAFDTERDALNWLGWSGETLAPTFTTGPRQANC
jgi:hypothetical protein